MVTPHEQGGDEMVDGTAIAGGTPVEALGAPDFRVSELFFSRTDDRGVIQAGNAVFARVSGYAWEELQGAPHRIVRHPDMPRAVFWLLWDRLAKRLPVGAYVKNRTKDGRYYWVFAVVMPEGDGYLSVRLKPTSAMLSRVEPLYARLRAQEEALEPEQSAAALERALCALGFSDYDDFMAQALYSELAARDAAMGKTDDRLDTFHNMWRAIDAVSTEANTLHAAFRDIRQIPINLRLAASRCEAAGGPIDVIAINYSRIADEALEHALHFTDFARKVLGRIQSGLFMMGAARLQREMVEIFRDETVEEPRMGGEVDRLERHFRHCGDQARWAVCAIADDATAFLDSSRRMRRFVGGLDVVRVACMIETRWQADGGGSFLSTIERLDRFHHSVETHLARIDGLNEDIIARTGQLLKRS